MSVESHCVCSRKPYGCRRHLVTVILIQPCCCCFCCLNTTNATTATPTAATAAAVSSGKESIPRVLFDMREMATVRWVNGHLSNFDYLMQLNEWAGRRWGDGVCLFVCLFIFCVSFVTVCLFSEFFGGRGHLDDIIWNGNICRVSLGVCVCVCVSVCVCVLDMLVALYCVSIRCS